MPAPGEIFELRMALSQDRIPWRACYPNGDRVHFPTISESGIRSLIIDYPDADRTGVLVDGKVVIVAGVEDARAALMLAKTLIEPGPKSGVEEVVTTPPAPAPQRPQQPTRKPRVPIKTTPSQLTDRRVKDRERKRLARRLEGRLPRSEWLADHTISRSKPWLQTGYSRSSWYRQRQVRCNDSDVKSG